MVPAGAGTRMDDHRFSGKRMPTPLGARTCRNIFSAWAILLAWAIFSAWAQRAVA